MSVSHFFQCCSDPLLQGDLIISGRAKPSFVVSHNLNLDQAAAAYEKFDKRVDGYTKVLLHP